MADISVTLVLDDKQYTSKLNEVNQRTEDFNKKAAAGLDKSAKGVKDLGTAFDSLKNKLIGLGLTAIIAEVNNFALGVQQAGNATGVSTETILAFSNAVGSVGGNAEKAVGDVIDFVSGLDAAKQGSASAQADLAKMGISLKELGSSSNEALFKKTVESIAAIGDASERNRLAVQMLGRSFKDIDVRDVANAMKTVGVDPAQVSAIRAGAEAQKTLISNLDNLRDAVLQIIEPLNNLVSKIDISVEAFKKIIEIAAAAGGAFLIFTKVIPMIQAALSAFAASALALANPIQVIGAAFAFLGKQIMGIWAGIDAFLTNLARGLGLLGSSYGMIGSLTFALAGLLRGLLRFAGIAGIIYAVAEAVDFLVKKFTDFSILDWVAEKFNKAWAAAKRFYDLHPDNFNPPSISEEESNNEIERLKKRAAAAQAERDAAAAANQRVIDANRAQKLELDKIVNAYKLAGAELYRQFVVQDNILYSIEEDGRLRLRSAEEQEKLTKLADIENNYIKQRNDLQTQYNNLKAAAAVGTKEEQLAFAAFAANYKGAQDKITAEYQKQRQEASLMIDRSQSLKLIEDDRQRTLQNITDAYNQQIDRALKLGDIIRETIAKQQDVSFEKAQMGRSPYERQQAQIIEDIRKARLEAGRTFSEAFSSEDVLPPERAQELADGLEKIRVKYDDIQKAQLDNLAASRTFAQGWKDAFNQYADDATNAAKIASDVFASATKGFEDSFVSAARHGKDTWRDFVNNLGEQILRSGIRALLASTFSTVGMLFGGGGIAGARAGGGPVEAGRPYLVGEKGPEIIIPNSSGTVIPNGQTAGSTSGSVAPVTYITNNISAVDAKSVAQLFADNRQILFGNVEQARKELPMRLR